MKLFIQIQDGQPVGHPILDENFRCAFPDIDTDNLPESFAHFVRVAPPIVGVYEVYEGVSYEWQNGLITDVHHTRAMTTEEIATKQNTIKTEWAKVGYASWVWHEELCYFKPPVPMPQDGNQYRWDEVTTSWVSLETA
jgi:hypothetical protein